MVLSGKQHTAGGKVSTLCIKTSPNGLCKSDSLEIVSKEMCSCSVTYAVCLTLHLQISQDLVINLPTTFYTRHYSSGG